MRTVKALAVWQPWASLLMAGIKKYETRSWKTKHRGWLALHAAKTAVGRDYAAPLGLLGYSSFDDLPRGCVLGVVYIDQIIETHGTMVSTVDRMYGDWGPGRYAWKITARLPFNEPIPARGFQRIWDWQMPDMIFDEQGPFGSDDWAKVESLMAEGKL